MTERLPRTLDRIVEDQVHRWQLARTESHEEARRRPVVTVSRQHGAGGSELASRLAQQMQLDLFDKELVHQIAESAHLGDSVVQALDDRDREMLADWLVALVSDSYLSPVGYHYHLTRVLGAIARHGAAVIVGRGGHLVLGPSEALRVLVVAPLEQRVRTVAQREGVGDREARQHIAAVESERRAFLQRHFHADFADPTSFDLVLNTGTLGVEGALGVVKAALHHAAHLQTATQPVLAR
jgi:cytidylate kinase